MPGSATQTRTLPITGVRQEAVTAAIAVVAAVVLPQLLHSLGGALGVGNTLAATWLPMHLPIILAGLLAGWRVGLVSGALAPLIAFALSGMPPVAMLPFMVIEMAAYGLVAGLLARLRVAAIWLVLATQVAGRLARLATVGIGVLGFGTNSAALAGVWDSVVAGLPGLVLQWTLIPLIMWWLRRQDRN